MFLGAMPPAMYSPPYGMYLSPATPTSEPYVLNMMSMAILHSSQLHATRPHRPRFTLLYNVVQKWRIVIMLRFGTGRQRMGLERWTNPKLSRRTCSPRYGLPSCRGISAGVAKRPRERSPTPSLSLSSRAKP
jgi:hypothetical protein